MPSPRCHGRRMVIDSSLHLSTSAASLPGASVVGYLACSCRARLRGPVAQRRRRRTRPTTSTSVTRVSPQRYIRIQALRRVDRLRPLLSALMTTAATLEWVTLDWPAERTVRLRIRETALNFGV